MLNFTFVQSVRILNGKGCISQVGELLKQAGYHKAFVVCGKSVETNGVLDKIRKSFTDYQISSVIYTDVKPDPPADLIEKGAALCIENMPEYAILDPELTMTMPYRLTLLTGLDTFSHCYEAYTSNLSNPMTDLICEKMFETVVKYLPIALAEPENYETREKMQNAASIGGWMLYNACAHVGHSIAHVIGAKLHIIHGAACAYDTPVLLKTISTVVPEKVRKIGKLLGAVYTGAENPEEIGMKAAQAYQAFVEQLQLEPVSDFIDSYSIDDTLLNELVHGVVNKPFAELTPIKVDESLAEKMLREILF